MMRIVELDERLRRKIVECVKPRMSDMFSYQNLDLITAVYDDENKFYLTRSYYLSESIKRSGDGYDEYGYVVVSGARSFVVSCKEYMNGEVRTSHFISFGGINEKNICAAIEYYKGAYSERRAVKKALGEQGKDVYGFTEQYLGGCDLK